MSTLLVPPQRLALAADSPGISALMRASVLELSPRSYDPWQTVRMLRCLVELAHPAAAHGQAGEHGGLS